MQAVAYIRVSSKGQHYALQHGAVMHAAAARGDDIGEIYQEKRSATELARPELDRLRAEVRAGRVKRLYIFRLDRLTRTGIKDTFELVDELRRHGCELVTCSDGFDLAGPLAEPLLAMMAWASKMENHARRERQAAARERIEQAGGRWGRPPRMTPELLQQAIELRGRHRSLRQIAVALKVPRATLARHLPGA